MYFSYGKGEEGRGGGGGGGVHGLESFYSVAYVIFLKYIF